MKTKSLTPWCSLYYSELKYNIKISPSANRAIFTLLFYLVFTYLTLTILIGFKLWLGLVITALFGLMTVLYRHARKPLISRLLTLLIAKEHNTTRFFVLSDSGLCQFNNKSAVQISANSQINLWGYWLVFKTSDEVLANQFIFKDSLSSQDQARLARTLMRVQKSPELNH